MIETNLIEDLRQLTPPSYDWAWGVLALVAAVALLVGLRGFLRRRAPRPTDVAAGSRALWEVAIQELEALAPLLQPERSRDYGIQATSVLRRYLEARYQLHAPLLATEEFLLAAAGSPALPEAHRVGLERFLELCDLFKFGRYVAQTDELGRLHAAAIEFVLASRPLAEDKPDEGGAA
jgi:hypothetical protein